MKKILIMAMSILSIFSTPTLAGSWDVVCLKQGAVRLKAAPERVLSTSDCTPPTSNPNYPIPARSIACQAKVAEGSDVVGDMNFVSLGFGGSIILSYSDKFGATPGPSNDITIYETTWGDPNCNPLVSESALVEFSQDGVNWTEPKSVCHNASLDISPLIWGKYVRITDKTPNINAVGDGNDGYDVDGVVATTDFSEQAINPICDWVQGVASQYVGAAGNYPGRGIVSPRKSISNANINDPSFNQSQFQTPSLREVSGWYNFWSIGFGGYACFQLPYSVFDAPGADFKIFETTWNNQPCPNYPEKVLISVSQDGQIWSQETLLCKDGLYDINGAYPVVNYIKFVDASNPADFGPGADSYDIDNIFILQTPPGSSVQDICDQPQASRRSYTDMNEFQGNGGVPEEMFPLTIVGDNIVNDNIKLKATILESGNNTFFIRNTLGQTIMVGKFSGKLYETPTTEMDVSNLSVGVYLITMSGEMESVKFIKY